MKSSIRIMRTVALSAVSLILFWTLFLAVLNPSAAHAADAPAATAENTWYETYGSNPTSYFPLTNNDGMNDIEQLLFESLLTRHWDTFEWMPQLANKWEVSADGKQFTFTLDPKAKFWDGAPVTAEDVKFSYDIIFREGMATAVLRPYYENIAKVEIVSPTQVRFVAKNVFYRNFDVCASLTIFQKKHYEKLIAKDKTMTKAEVTKDPMGTGSWRIEKVEENQQLILRRDPKYWNREVLEKRGEWTFQRYIIRIIQESSVAYEAFRRGDLTMHIFQPKEWALNSDGPEFKTRITKVQVVNKVAKSYDFIAWNNIDPLFANKDIRWAMSHLANLSLWNKKFNFNLYEPTIGPYSVKSEENDPTLKPVEFSLEKARQRLAAAGWTKADKDGVLIKDGKRFEVEIMYPVQAKDVREPVLTEYKNTAAKVGVAIQLKAVEWTSFTKLMDEHKFQGIVLAWGRGIDRDLKQIWHSASIADQGSNFVSYKNPEVDKLIDEHRQTLERPKRIEIARKLQRLIYEDQPYTFLNEPKFTLYAHQNYIKKAQDTFNYSIGNEFWSVKPTLP